MKVSVVLFKRQLDRLDRLIVTMRARTGTHFSRATIIRALLDAINECRVDVGAIRSPDDLKALCLKRLQRN